MPFRAFAARSLIVLVMAAGSATPALAQHVVTDDEAGKLTLDALTATPAPMVHRVAYRPLSRRSVYLPAAVRARMRTVSAVHESAWRRPAHTASRSHAVHGKARRG